MLLMQKEHTRYRFERYRGATSAPFICVCIESSKSNAVHAQKAEIIIRLFANEHSHAIMRTKLWICPLFGIIFTLPECNSLLCWHTHIKKSARTTVFRCETAFIRKCVEIWLADDEKRDYIIILCCALLLPLPIQFKLKILSRKVHTANINVNALFIHHDNDSDFEHLHRYYVPCYKRNFVIWICIQLTQYRTM